MTATPLIALAVERLVAGESLSTLEARDAVAAMLDGEASEGATAAFLTALRIKGETGDELLGAVTAIRERMIAFESGRPDCLDTCGTGGDGARSVNISTGAAVVVAACGVPVVKHGNRAATGRSGSSDVLGALGVAVEVEPAVLRQGLADLGIAFLFAPRFHPGLRGVAAVRRQLPFRTIFNLVGPLCNPASPAFQLVGVPDAAHAERMAEVLARTGSIRRAAVVRGSDGLDEVTLAGDTHVLLVEDGRISARTWTIADFGLPPTGMEGLRVEGPEESAGMLRQAFAGRPGPTREYLLANSAAALWTATGVPLRQAVEQAAAALDSGRAARLMDRWAGLTTQPASP
ncbi:MAG: anthranilate phosphoribosyltransferase [Paludisphaera borealis]|uniref:anthranilate phosphoribosyltransferase n=1 Tax=Paludisphaera borealis TaxID=1387353 RepID=UPI00283CA7CF|nr:anthranilate phosphoribosyltransferase [Paludisphaera borealis]MDR3621355.1 anthranilate phosphoribosyltransferase [Paludisphaera borealis]